VYAPVEVGLISRWRSHSIIVG